MQKVYTLLILVISVLIIGSCTKEGTGGTSKSDPFDKLTGRNQLPYNLPTTSNQSDGNQTKEIFFYDKDQTDVIFRAIGVSDSMSKNTKLWVQIMNPDIKIFADTRIDSSFKDTIYVNGVAVEQVHNRLDGKNFYKLDTTLLALPFSKNELDTKRPNLFDQTVATVHVQFSENYNGSNTPHDIERGVLKRTNNAYVGFKNIADGRMFFVELEDRYTLKSIEMRRD